MVAMTVILGAVVSGFALGLGDNLNSGAPQASFEFDFNDSTGDVTVTHTNGNRLNGDQLRFAGAAVNKDTFGGISEWAGGDVTAGDSATVEVRRGETLTVVWQSTRSTQTATLAAYDVPSGDGPIVLTSTSTATPTSTLTSTPTPTSTSTPTPTPTSTPTPTPTPTPTSTPTPLCDSGDRTVNPGQQVGPIAVTGTVTISGRVTGDVRAGGDVTLNPGSNVAGDVLAGEDVTVDGRVDENVRAGGNVNESPGGSVGGSTEQNLAPYDPCSN